jgi:hypothetical protein
VGARGLRILFCSRVTICEAEEASEDELVVGASSGARAAELGKVAESAPVIAARDAGTAAGDTGSSAGTRELAEAEARAVVGFSSGCCDAASALIVARRLWGMR